MGPKGNREFEVDVSRVVATFLIMALVGGGALALPAEVKDRALRAALDLALPSATAGPR
jgi:hypothetical protein